MTRKINWAKSPKSLARLRKAVSKYNAAVTRMENMGIYTSVPNRTSVEREMRLIETSDELRQREKELGRILLKNNPRATEQVVLGTEIVPQYLAQEMKYALRTINERRKEQREALFGEAPMEAFEYATRVANKNLHDLNEEFYTDGDDLDDLWEEKYPKTFEYAERYKQAWMEYNGDSTVPQIIDWFAEYEPDELALIFESGADEVDINYIYVVSADKTPIIIRHNNILRFWNNQYRAIKNKDFDGYDINKYEE